MEDGMSQEELFETTNIDPWFLSQLGELHQAEQWIKSKGLTDISTADFIQVKKRGFSDIQISRLTGALEESVFKRLGESSGGAVIAMIAGLSVLGGPEADPMTTYMA